MKYEYKDVRPYKECVAAVAADHAHALGLDWQSWLGGLLLWDHHHRTQVDDPSAGGPEKLCQIFTF